MNILTFDVEEWFHLLDFDATRTEAEWGKYEVRIHENVDRILDILDRTDTKATFFIIGWVAKTYPEVVKKIAAKYQIGSHTMNHQLVWQQKPSEFKEDVESSVKLLQDITGQPVECFRAPGFSIREQEAWAFDILAELGIKYDCSVFPAHHAHGGMPGYAEAYHDNPSTGSGQAEDENLRHEVLRNGGGICKMRGIGPAIIKHGGVEMKEFPVTTKEVMGRQVIFSGGGYFRLAPYWLIHKWSREAAEAQICPVRVTEEISRNAGYLLSYIHPRDLDGGQPMLEGLPMARKFKSYVGLKQAPEKLRKYLKDFKFVDVQTASDMIAWDRVPRIEL